jgi:hypothetical protein
MERILLMQQTRRTQNSKVSLARTFDIKPALLHIHWSLPYQRVGPSTLCPPPAACAFFVPCVLILACMTSAYRIPSRLLPVDLPVASCSETIAAPNPATIPVLSLLLTTYGVLTPSPSRP